jgi:hypothetical protein
MQPDVFLTSHDVVIPCQPVDFADVEATDHGDVRVVIALRAADRLEQEGIANRGVVGIVRHASVSCPFSGPYG